MKSRSHKKNKNKNKNTKKKIGGTVDGFPDLFSPTGQLNLDTYSDKTTNNNKYYLAAGVVSAVLVGVLVSIK